LDTPEPTQPQIPEANTPAATPAAASETNGANATTVPGNGPTNGPAAQVTRREAPPPVPSRKYYTITELNEAKPKDMLAIAKEFGVTDITPATLKPELITRILQAQTEAQGNIFAQGILEIVEDGFGFLRRRSLLPSPDDVYVGSSQVRRLGLRTGDVQHHGTGRRGRRQIERLQVAADHHPDHCRVGDLVLREFAD